MPDVIRVFYQAGGVPGDMRLNVAVGGVEVRHTVIGEPGDKCVEITNPKTNEPLSPTAVAMTQGAAAANRKTYHGDC